MDYDDIDKNSSDYGNYVKSIAHVLQGLSCHQSLEVLCETISVFVAARNKALADTAVDVVSPESDEPIVDVSSAFRFLRQIRKVPQKTKNSYIEPCMPFNENLIRRRRLSMVENAPDIQAFIHNLDRYYSGPEMLAVIEKHFGKERTPSKSSLHRYLQKISRAANLNREDV